MTEQLPLDTPRIAQRKQLLSPRSAELHANLVILLDNERRLADVPEANTIRARMRDRGIKLTPEHPFTTDLPNRRGTKATVALIDPKADTFTRLTRASEVIGMHADAARLAIACYGANTRATCEAVLAAAFARSGLMPDFRSRPEPKKALREIEIFGVPTALPLPRLAAEAKGNNLARYLTMLPANKLTPGSYRARIQRLARAQGWQQEFLGIDRLKRLGAGAFLAVAQGSPEPDAGILHLKYRPRRATKNARALALVGKGICFDTGGTNLKVAKHMHGMHEDMEGSAVALGVLLALSELEVGFPIDCWLALAQNHIGPKAYKQNEVVTAANGKTIEVMHTDAEGRMILADALHFAARAKPSLIIDYATLTGACVYALGTRMSGAFTNRPELIPRLIEAGRSSGERVWPFPLERDYEKALKSEIADIKQCTLEGEADHILAAIFLSHFVHADKHEPDWVHIDLASGNNKSGLAHVPSDITGFGVRYTLDLLLDQGLIDNK